ncbi:hypothetical protein, partial [Streptomyces althioticus]|uniref:hypothetical protein n=1 Tax=Streptomyces althioticus TaxID=83380 RepID=UPI00332D3EFB
MATAGRLWLVAQFPAPLKGRLRRVAQWGLLMRWSGGCGSADLTPPAARRQHRVVEERRDVVHPRAGDGDRL